MTRTQMPILPFEPQDDITGFLERWKRQHERGLELTCPYKYDGTCENPIRESNDPKIPCDNKYTECEDYRRINRSFQEE